MRKLVVIESCMYCPSFDPLNDICLKYTRETHIANGIPAFCPLPDVVE